MTIYGGGQRTLSFCVGDDLIVGPLSVMHATADVAGPVSIGNPRGFTMLALADEVLAPARSHSRRAREPLSPDDHPQRRHATERTRSVLDCEPRVGLGVGPQETTASPRHVLAAPT